ncbi:MAG TPA: glycosyltransferase [Solirubrobacteraceae bacterium]|jgi:cellulose synthase/poly-beta-1,6-N-acetylglucosamine synthase-like glycosyltransferase|nr:glycosyltransferase [Solirubrobacteraceae bacterium]
MTTALSDQRVRDPMADRRPAPGSLAAMASVRWGAAEEIDPARTSDIAVAAVPEDVCRLFGVLPVHLAGDLLTVAISNPDDDLTLSVVAQQVRSRNLRLAVIVVPADLLQAAIDGIWPPSPQAAPQPEPARPPQTIPQPAPPRPPPPAAAPSTLFDPGPRAAPERSVPAAAPATPWAPPGGPLLLGELLIDQQLVSAEQLASALDEQQRVGDRLGDILTHSGVLREERLVDVLAGQLEMPITNLEGVTPEPEALALIDGHLSQHHRIVPLAIEDDALTIAMVDPLDDGAIAELSRAAGMPLRALMASDTAVDHLLQDLYAPEHVHAATSLLLERRPEESAFVVTSHGQRVAFGVLVGLTLLSLVLNPLLAVIGFNLAAGMFYLSFSGYKFWLAYDSLSHDSELAVTDEEVRALDERRLPTFTVLVPLYREAAVVGKLTGAVAQLDYPRTKLDVKLLLEADDEETLAAVQALDLPPNFRTVIVPDAPPKTKPKACNYGLLHARGDIVVIYDAEDLPDSDQLKKVVVAFSKSDPATVCIQCKLNYYNRDQNLLTRWFTTEYSMWFDVFMPGLDSHDSPIPLGGTSNHFITQNLLELGAWDPHNVAEDADLGIRLNKAGWRTAIVDSTTYEEANPDLPNWIRQRSRWVKGYMQTWLVHMRHPVQMARAIGLRSFMSFQLVVGGTFVGFLLNPIYWALTSLWLVTEAGLIRQLFPSFVYYAAAVGLVLGNFVFTYLNVAGSMRRGYFGLVKYALFSPLYWGLMSVAAWKGAIQLVTKPHYWEKTVHGLADFHPDDAISASVSRPAADPSGRTGL